MTEYSFAAAAFATTVSGDLARYEIVLDVLEDSINVAFGALVEGTGQVWVDGFRFSVVGRDVPTTP